MPHPVTARFPKDVSHRYVGREPADHRNVASGPAAVREHRARQNCRMRLAECLATIATMPGCVRPENRNEHHLSVHDRRKAVGVALIPCVLPDSAEPFDCGLVGNPIA